MQEQKGNGRRVLVVEDDLSSGHGLTRLLCRRGFQAVHAGTVAEALALLEPPPDLLLLDLILPDANGIEVLRRVRERKLPTRVGVTTAADDPTLLDQVSRLRPEALFGKPLDLVDLADWLENG